MEMSAAGGLRLQGGIGGSAADIWRGAGCGQGRAAAPGFPPGKWGR